MKRVFKCVVMLAIATMFTNYQADAQIGIGGGATYNVLTETYDGNRSTYALNGFFAEVYYNSTFSDQLSAAPSLKFVRTNGIFPGTDNSGRWTEQYLDLTVVKLKSKIYELNTIEFYLSPSIIMSYCLTSKLNINGTSMDVFELFDEIIGGENLYQRDDVRIGLSLSAAINRRINIEIGYEMGLVDRFDYSNDDIVRTSLNAGVFFNW